MLEWFTPDTLAVLSLAALFGGMLFFSGVMAPLVFVKLPPATAGRFIRELFPWYYLVMGAVALTAFVLLLISQADPLAAERLLIGGVVIGFVVARQWLMPRINQARDAAVAGETGQSSRFKTLHTLSVVINAVQILICLSVLIRLV